ncbi:MAG: ABC transporter permease [Candidatus Hodarchaeales archaeon]|jgi:simple sugar transport system permease protein
MKIGLPKFTIKKRPVPYRGLEAFLIRAYTLIAGLAFVGILFIFRGVNPLSLYGEILRVAYFTDFGITQTALNFIPLFLIGIGIAIPARAKIDNIGGEGQFIIGAMGAFWVATTNPDLGPVLLITAMFLVGFLCGAIWAIPIALFRAKGGFKGSDVVVSFLMVFNAQFLLVYMVNGPWITSLPYSYPQTDPIPSDAELPFLSDIPLLGNVLDVPVHITIILAFVLVFLLNYFLFKTYKGISKTKLGYEINVIGKNQTAGNIAGMNYLKIALITVIISGGLAGIAGVGQLAGNESSNYLLRPGISTGFGFTAIAVAWLGGLNPVGIFFSALLFAGLLTGNLPMQGKFGLPSTTVDLLNGSILFFVLIAEFLLQFSITRRRNE